jgi:hypothetical protein
MTTEGQNEGTIAGNTQYVIFGSSFKNLVTERERAIDTGVKSLWNRGKLPLKQGGRKCLPDF